MEQTSNIVIGVVLTIGIILMFFVAIPWDAGKDKLSPEDIARYQDEGYTLTDDGKELYRDNFQTMCALESLGLDKNLHGKTFLTMGHLESEPVYEFYYHTEDGGFELGYIPAEECRIYYIQDDEVPHIDENLGTRVISAADGEFLYVLNGAGPKYKIYIPEGSIVNDYELDLGDN